MFQTASKSASFLSIVYKEYHALGAHTMRENRGVGGSPYRFGYTEMVAYQHKVYTFSLFQS